MASGETGAVLVIVPAYNEEAALGEVLDSIPAQLGDVPVDVLVINDGSTDDTARVARARGARVIDLPFNLGIGAAVQAGFKFARDRGYGIAVQLDGDGQHRADQIPLLLEALSGGLDMVIGSRFLSPAEFVCPPLRRLGIAVFAWLDSRMAGQRITDSTSGFRAYGRRAIELLARVYPHDYPEPEAIVLLTHQGFRIGEVGVAMRPRRGGRSSITIARAAYYMVKVVLAIVVEAFRGRTVHEEASR
jgi:glycosyltransferase involved in cell wall biosynthesis